MDSNVCTEYLYLYNFVGLGKGVFAILTTVLWKHTLPFLVEWSTWSNTVRSDYFEVTLLCYRPLTNLILLISFV